jgi:CRISPR-associated exonuclease Cas4
VPKGAIYHVSSRRRREVTFNNDMRKKVEVFTVQIREMIEKGIVPPAEHNEKCRNCSLIDACLPEVVDPNVKRMRFLLQRLFKPMEE